MSNEKKHSLIAHAKNLSKKLEKVLTDATNPHKNPVAVLAEYRHVEKEWNQMLKDSHAAELLTDDDYDTMSSLMAFVSTQVAKKEKKSWKEEGTTINALEAFTFRAILNSANSGIAEKEKSLA